MVVEFYNTTTRFYSKDGVEPSTPDAGPVEIDIAPNWGKESMQFINYNTQKNEIYPVSSETNTFVILDLTGHEGETLVYYGRTQPASETSFKAAFASSLKQGQTIQSLCNATSTISEAVIVDDPSWYFIEKTESTIYKEYRLTIPVGAKYLISAYTVSKKGDFYAKVVTDDTQQMEVTYDDGTTETIKVLKV